MQIFRNSEVLLEMDNEKKTEGEVIQEVQNSTDFSSSNRDEQPTGANFNETNTPKKGSSFSIGTFLLGVVVGAVVSTCVFGVAIAMVRNTPSTVTIMTNSKSEKSSASTKNSDNSAEDTETGDDEEEQYDSVVNEETMAKLQLLEETIDSYYIDSDSVTTKTLQDGMYEGMLDSLGDVYSVYYTEEELADFMEDTNGVYYGIGAYISTDEATGLPIIAGVFDGSPAQEAGLKEGDICYKVDGEITESMALDEFVSKVKGEENTTVVLTIIREGESDYLDIEVERRQIDAPTVKYEMKEGNIGYIQITEFDSVTSDQFTEALVTLKEQGMKGLVLDLRSNPGGNLDTVVEIANQLLPKGTVVYTVDKDGNRVDYDCDGKNEFELPMVVLVNGYSASASEILAGAIKDYDKGILVGTTTFGKGIVQRIIPFSDGTAVKLTVSKYYTPNGVNIHGTGIDPDVEIEYDAEAAKEGVDNQLEKALELVGEEIDG